MIRLGRISYVNMAPVFYRLGADVDEVAGVPTELNERLLAGEADGHERNAAVQTRINHAGSSSPESRGGSGSCSSRVVAQSAHQPNTAR